MRKAAPADFSIDGEYVYEVSEVQSKVVMLATMTRNGIHLETKSGTIVHEYPWSKIATFRVLPSGNVFIFEVVVDGILAGWQLKTEQALDMVGTSTAFVDALVAEAGSKGHSRSSAAAGSSSSSTGGGRVRRSRAGSSASAGGASASSSRRGTRRGTGVPVAVDSAPAVPQGTGSKVASPLGRASAASRDSKRSSKRVSATVKIV